MSETHLSDIQGLIAMAFLTRLGGGGDMSELLVICIYTAKHKHILTPSQRGFRLVFNLLRKYFK